ncbi:Isopentenyl-diphosphate Delta-isomerase II-like protein [Drosera capensis]
MSTAASSSSHFALQLLYKFNHRSYRRFASPSLIFPSKRVVSLFSTTATAAATPAAPMAAAAVVAEAHMDAVQRRLMFDDECILVDENDHQRSSTKVTFPLVWTNTCCSHPLYRESELIEQDALGVRNAAQRKLLDELGIPAKDVPVDEFVPLGRMLYKAPSDGKWGEHELDYLLFIIKDVKLNPNLDEVADVKYVNRHQLKELCEKADAGEEGLKLSPWFRLVVDNFLYKWWDHVESSSLKEVADMNTIHRLV